MTKKLLYTVPETSHALSIGRTTVNKLIREGNLNPVKIGRRTLIPVEDIERIAKPNGKPADYNGVGDSACL